MGHWLVSRNRKKPLGLAGDKNARVNETSKKKKKKKNCFHSCRPFETNCLASITPAEQTYRSYLPPIPMQIW